MKVIEHNTFNTFPLEDNSVQAVITSPPYWGLRQYDIPDIIIGGEINCDHKCTENTSGECFLCGAWKGQYGLEPTFQQYIKNTLIWCSEIYRVLKDDGIFFLNIGDTYSGKKKGNSNNKQKEGVNNQDFIKETPGLPAKTKLMIPHRAAIALIDELGFICRNDIIWQKPNAMPESAKDRLSKKYENIFMFSKNQKYYFDLDAITIKYSGENYGGLQPKNSMSAERDNKTDKFNELSDEEKERYKNPGDIWNIATQPSPFSHYAMWPEKLVERMIKCSTKKGDIILDPFAGSGTTLAVAESLGRDSIGFDIGYKDIQEQRLSNIQGKLI